MRMLSVILIAAALLAAAPLHAQDATPTPDFYLPTAAELPAGVVLQEALGPTPLGIEGDLQERRNYASSLPPALVQLTVITGTAETAAARYAATLSAFLSDGYAVSRPNGYADGTTDLELARSGEVESQCVRLLVFGNVVGLVRVTSRNELVSPEEASTLAESIAAPMLARIWAQSAGF